MPHSAHQPAPPSWTQRFHSLPWSTRLTGCLAVALLLIAAAMSNRPRGGAQFVSLLGDSRLQTLDLQRMRLALARAGIVDAEVREQQLWLPKEKVSAALKTIEEQDLLPGSLQTSTLTAPQISPFVSRYQQQLQQQHQKKLAIQALLRRLAFVADASLEIDFQDSATSAQPDRSLRCTITIQPLDGHFLEPAQLETIRQIALGSLSQLRREDLVIVDLAAGMAFDDKLLAQPQTAEQLSEIQVLRCRQKLDREIRRVLADFGNLDVEISCREAGPDVVGFAPGSIAPASPARVRGLLASSQLNLPGTNGVASIPTAASPRENQSTRDTNPAESPAALVEFQPQVTIRLANHVAAKSANAADSLAWTMEQDQLRQEILRRVRPLLPESAFAELGREPVVVEFPAAPGSTPSDTRLELPWGEFLSSRSGGILIAVVSTAGLGLLLIASLRRRERSSACPVADEPVAAGDGGVREQHLKEQIDELLRSHPDTAANVIRDWIQKAA